MDVAVRWGRMPARAAGLDAGALPAGPHDLVPPGPGINGIAAAPGCVPAAAWRF